MVEGSSIDEERVVFCIQYQHYGKVYTVDVPMAKSFADAEVVKGSTYVLQQLLSHHEDAAERAQAAHERGEVQEVVFSKEVPGFMQV